MLQKQLDSSSTFSSELTGYLNHIGWQNQQFSQEKLEAMFVAGCLRFLGGVTEFTFIRDLSHEISIHPILHEKLKKSTNLIASLEKSSNNLSRQKEIINKAQELLTGRSYLA